MADYFLGIDVGTSGARSIAIDQDGLVQSTASISFGTGQQSCADWRAALVQLLAQLPALVRSSLRAIAINGTSSTVLICNAQGEPIVPPLFYNDGRGVEVLDQIRAIAPPQHPVISATSSLAKLVWWIRQQAIPTDGTYYFLHQADWLGFLLHGHLGMSDYHNALKLGYDVGELSYPDWLRSLPLPVQLPVVVAPGTAIAPITPALAQQFQLPSDCWVCAGTTDSIAAFLASGAQTAGEAVTSLGSTLVLKLLSQTRVDQANWGIYSHRLGDLWLVGGASNTGGAVLRQFFSDAELEALSQQIDPDRPSSLDYYPLLRPGERFPINDPALAPRLSPRPASDVEFLQGLLESMAQIEALGYRQIQTLGASPLTLVYTAGGGARNGIWTQMRSRQLGVPVQRALQTEAAYGSAQLARQGVVEGANRANHSSSAP